MQYIYVTERENYEDLAAGRVILNRPGATSFPIRLASEVFQRCAGYLESLGKLPPYRIYDPCCGMGYLLTVIGFLHGDDLGSIYAADIDPEALEFARRNLALLTAEGMEARMHQLEKMIEEFDKDSHHDAYQSAHELHMRLPEGLGRRICFVSDATSPPMFSVKDVDILITDVPYGNATHWSDDGDSISDLLEAQRGTLAAQSVVAVISDKAQRTEHPAYERIAKLNAGKRLVTLLRPV